MSESNPSDGSTSPPTDADHASRARVRRELDGRHRRPDGPYAEKLDEETLQQIVTAIGAGAEQSFAAAFAGVNRKTFYRWMTLGRREDADPLYQRLVAEVEKALATLQVQLTALQVQAANQGDVRAGQFMLERRFPHQFGRHERVDIGNPDGETFRTAGLNVDLSRLAEMSSEELAQLEGLLAKAAPVEGENVIEMRQRRQLRS